MKRKKKVKLPEWVRWYICGEYHCDRCPYSWEERNYDGDGDAGCHLFGELRDTCRHIRNPISQLIVNKHRNEYECFYDGWAEYGEQYDLCAKLYEKISEDIKSESYVPDVLKGFMEKYDQYDGTHVLMDIVTEYELLAHPRKTSWQKLKEAFSEWWADFKWRHFKCYFRRKK